MANDDVNDKLPTLKELDAMGVPRKSVMCGFVVHVSDDEEFLVSETSNSGVEVAGWSGSPENALRYPNAQAAYSFVKAYHKRNSVVCVLFEHNNQYLVYELPEKNFK